MSKVRFNYQATKADRAVLFAGFLVFAFTVSAAVYYAATGAWWSVFTFVGLSVAMARVNQRGVRYVFEVTKR